MTSRLSGLAIAHVEFQPPWKQTSFWWLEDPELIDGRSRCYRFVGGSTRDFPRELVINHRLQVTRQFSAGQSVEGLLLGFSCDSIPATFSQGAMISTFLVLYDQFARPYRAPVELWTDRTTKNLRPARSGAKRKGRLLDKRDTIKS